MVFKKKFTRLSFRILSLHNAKSLSFKKKNFLRRDANVKKQRRRFREDPFIFLDKAGKEDLSRELREHYGVDAGGKFSVDNLLLRTSNTERKKSVYYVNDRLKEFLHANAERFRIVNAGVGILRKVEKVSPCGFRLMQDVSYIFLAKLQLKFFFK